MGNQGLQSDNRQSTERIINDDNLQTYESETSSAGVGINKDRSHLQQDIHIIHLDDLFARLDTDPNRGLSGASASKAHQKYGDNRISSPKLPGFLSLLFKELFMGFNIILWVAGIFAFLAYKPFGEPNPSIANLALGIILALVIISNSLLNVYQEIKSLKFIASFSKILSTFITVYRDNQQQQIPVDQVVPGDIIIIQKGDKIPADCRFLMCEGLKINIMTENNVPRLTMPTVHPTSENWAESNNIGLYPSVVEEGTGKAVVIATGDNTDFGKKSKMRITNVDNGITGLHREVNRFVLFVLIATLIFVGILWITWAAWLNQSHPTFLTYNENIVNSIGMIVAFLPLGLPSTVTLVLTVVAKKMYRQNMLVKSLQIVETFNSVSVIATDIADILTENKIIVTHFLWDIKELYEINLMESMSLSNELPKELPIHVFQELLRAAILCNNAEEQITQVQANDQETSNFISKSRLVGDVADKALYNLCTQRFTINITEVRNRNPQVKVIPPNSSTKCMISINQLESNESATSEDAQTVLVMMKGATEHVIQFCSHYKTKENEVLRLDDKIKQNLLHRHEELSKNGYQVIAVCQRKLARKTLNTITEEINEDETELLSNDYCFIGGFTFVDPPRVEVPDSIDKARRAQIRVAIMTSDSCVVAKSVAKKVHIFTPDISDVNGTDTIESFQDTNGRIIFKLYRNEQLFCQHDSNSIIHVPSQNNNHHNNIVAVHTDDSDIQSNRTLVWYKRAWASCRNQFTEPKSGLAQIRRVPYIPYAVLVDGANINSMDDFMWDWVLSHQELVFANVSPTQRCCIVKEFKRRGEVIAVTGNTTGEVSALECAQLGIAMKSSAEASKESSDVILLDNNFAWITQAIETGRLLGDNLKKVAIYLLPGGSWSQIWPLFFNLWFGMPLALSAIWCTIFCMLNDVFMSLAMAAEKPESDIMSRAPHNREKDHLLNLKLLVHAYLFVGNFECFTAFFCFCYYWIDNGVPFYSFMFTYENFGINPPIPYTRDQLVLMNNVAQSIYYCSMCLFQFFNFFATRTRYTSILKHNPIYGKGQNLYVFVTIAVSAGIQLIFTQIEWFNHTLGTGRVPIKYILPTFGFGFLWLIIDELRKFLLKMYPQSFITRISW